MRFERARTIARQVWHRAEDGLLVVVVFAASVALYLQTLAPSVATLYDDSLEFPVVAHELAIAHPTGYPLYTLLAKLFTLGPVPNVAWAVNFLSAVTGALTVALVYLVARELTRRRLPALLGALALAVSPVFWSQSIIAEVYGLNSVFVAALLWLVLRWARRPLAPVKPFTLLFSASRAPQTLFLPGEGIRLRLPPAVRRTAHRVHALYRRLLPAVPPARRLQPSPLLHFLALLFGLGLAHHRLTVLLAPALFLFALLVERRVFSRAALLGPEHPERPRWLQIVGRPVVLLSICLVAPLLLYLYLPLRGQVGSLDGVYTNTLRGFWGWVTASTYSAFLSDNPLARDLDAAFYAGLFWQQFGPLGLALALLGMLGLVRRPKALVLTGLAFVTYVVFAILYRVPDVEVFCIPAFLVVATWIGVGLDYAADLLRIRGHSLALRRLLAVVLVLVFVGAIVQPLLIAARAYPVLDLSRRWIVHDYGLYVLDQSLPEDSTIVGIGGEMTLLRYFQSAEGLRPELELVRADDEGERLEAIESALAGGRSVFVTRPLPGLSDRVALGSVIGLIDVLGDPETLVGVGEPQFEAPALPRPVDLELVPGLRLLGYGLHEHQGHWRAWTRLRLWWQAPQGLQESFQVSARLLDAGGQLVAATDVLPVSGTYLPPAWRPGEIVADAYEIPLPAGLPAGDYTPLVIVYDPASGAEWGRAELDPVYLAGSPLRPPRDALEESVSHRAHAVFGDVELLGFTPPNSETPHHPGDILPLTLLWQAREQPTGELRVAFWLEALDEVPLGEEPLGGRFPADRWVPGQVVGQWPDLRVPDDTPPGPYRLKMRVSRDGQPVPWGRWFIPLGSDLALGEIQVEHQR